MVERAPNYDEENEQPEEANDLNISPTELVNRDKGDCATNDSSNRDDHQTLPDIVNEKRVD